MKARQATALALATAVACGTVMAQQAAVTAGAGPRMERERRPAEGGMMYMGGGDQGAMIARALANTRVLTEAGVTPEQAEKLKAGLKEIDLKMIDLDAAIRKASLTQTEQVSKLLADAQPSSPETVKQMMKTIEEIGGLRTEQAKLQTQRLIVIREHLTPEQIAKVRTAYRASFQDRMRGGERPAEGGAGQQGGRGEQPRNREGAGGGREGNRGPARPARPEGWGE